MQAEAHEARPDHARAVEFQERPSFARLQSLQGAGFSKQIPDLPAVFQVSGSNMCFGVCWSAFDKGTLNMKLQLKRRRQLMKTK